MLQSGYWPMFCYGFTCVNVSLNALTCRPRGVSYNLAFFAVVFGPLRYLQRLVYGFSHSFVSPAVARVDIHIYICSYTIWVAYLKKKKTKSIRVYTNTKYKMRFHSQLLTAAFYLLCLSPYQRNALDLVCMYGAPRYKCGMCVGEWIVG